MKPPPPPVTSSPVTPTVKKSQRSQLFKKKEQPSTPEQHPSQQPSPSATPSSSKSASPAPSFEKVPKRGRPHKDMQPPSFDDFPVGGSAEGEEYCKKESAYVSKAYSKKKGIDVETESPEDELSIIDDNGEDSGETKEKKTKEQIRIRYLQIFIKYM